MSSVPSPPTGSPELRDIGDAPALRTRIYDNALGAVQGWPKLARGALQLSLENPHYADPPTHSLQEQRKAILERGTLGRRLRGTWTLADTDTGLVLDRKTTTIATIPALTDRGTFINNGSEYALRNQLRLRPGVYTREKENGALVEAHVNTPAGQAPSHRYQLDPAKGVFYTEIGQARIPLMPLLRAVGATPQELREAWGGDDRAQALLEANTAQDNPAFLRKYHERLLRGPDRELAEPEQTARVVAKLGELTLDPEVTRRTMTHPHTAIDKPALLDITRKLLAVSRGEAEVDDRDNLAYQEIVGPEDLIAERLAKDAGGLRRQLLHKVANAGSLRHVPPNYLTPQVRAALLSSGLGNALEETNLAEVLDKQFSITRMGVGGLPSSDAIPETSRNVNDSQLSFLDPIRSPESERIGVDLFLASRVRKGPRGQIYAPFQDVRSGQTVYRAPQETADLTVAFPGELASGRARVHAIQGGRIRSVPRGEVDLELPHFEQAFSPLGNLIPFKSAVKGQRMSMGSRMLTQALPVVGAEAPLVQAGMPDQPGRSYEQHYGSQLGAIFAPGPVRVTRVTPDLVELEHADGKKEQLELARQFPFNRKSSLTQTPVVQVGQQLAPGQIIARSNFTDAQGQAALGLNARVAMLPYKGLNFEDAVVISEAFAKRLSAENMYSHRLEATDQHKLGRRDYVALFPQKFNRQQLATIDEAGLVRPGTVVNYGDPLFVAVRAQDPGQSRVHKPGAKLFSDAAVTWEHHAPGQVTDAVRTERGLNVLVQSVIPTGVGDKMSARWGNKGVVAQIVPDEQMPHDKRGQPFEVLLNPLGVISRGNPAQAVEMALSKVAEKTGQPYRVADFGEIKDLTAFAQAELKKHNLTSTEDVIDPTTGRTIPGVLTGRQFMLRLHHLADDKIQGRGVGSYTAEDVPSKGPGGQAKRLSLQEVNALLSHGAIHNLRDALQLRGQRNDDFWLNFIQGNAPPAPRVPQVWHKFVASLAGSGVHVLPDANSNLHLLALTDQDVAHLAGDRELQSSETVDVAKSFQPVTGGLFDPALTGGLGGNRWSAIKLHEPLPSPVLEDPIRYTLGLTKKSFEGVLAGREPLGPHGTGPAAIAQALRQLNLPQEIARARQDAAKRRGAGRDAANRRLGYLLGAQRQGLHPRDWVLSRVPVLPPVFRPIGLLGDRQLPVVADANLLYKDLLEANDNLKNLAAATADVGPERLALYQAFKAVTGLGDPVSKQLQEKGVKGLLGRVLGSSPKQGMVQRRLLSTTVDLVGRGVVSPDPDLDMDSVGLPEARAWDIYRNFVVRRLRRQGMPLTQALQHADQQTPAARQELLAEMADRPVLVSRSPVLHKLGIMAFYPRLTAGSTIRMSPLVVKGFGMDFDGDQSNFHVPVEEAARKEAIERLLPSQNLFSAADFSTPTAMPSQEYVGGLYAATDPARRTGRTRRFASRADARRAWARGELDLGDEVLIPE